MGEEEDHTLAGPGGEGRGRRYLSWSGRWGEEGDISVQEMGEEGDISVREMGEEGDDTLAQDDVGKERDNNTSAGPEGGRRGRRYRTLHCCHYH